MSTLPWYLTQWKKREGEEQGKDKVISLAAEEPG